MRPPVRRGHVRSASAGGNFSLTQALRGQQVQRNNSAVNSKDTKGMYLFKSFAFLKMGKYQKVCIFIFAQWSKK